MPTYLAWLGNKNYVACNFFFTPRCFFSIASTTDSISTPTCVVGKSKGAEVPNSVLSSHSISPNNLKNPAAFPVPSCTDSWVCGSAHSLLIYRGGKVFSMQGDVWQWWRDCSRVAAAAVVPSPPFAKFRTHVSLCQFEHSLAWFLPFSPASGGLRVACGWLSLISQKSKNTTR